MERTALKILANIRRHYNKKPRDPITIYEFCENTSLRKSLKIPN